MESQTNNVNNHYQQPVNQDYNTYASNIKSNEAEVQIKNIDIESGQEANNSFNGNEIEKMIRIGFIKKVYVILSAQLIITCLMIAVTFNNTSALFFQKSIGVFWTCVALSLMIGIFLICFKKFARSVPTNYLLLTLWTFCKSWMVATCASYYDPISVFIAVSLTAGVTCALTIYACKTKTDFTYCGGLLFAGSSLLLLLGIFFMIFGFSNYNSSTFKIINILYCGIGVFIFSLYLIYDTQLVIGKFGIEYSIDDYIIAAMMIYVDILQLFMFILSLLGNRR